MSALISRVPGFYLNPVRSPFDLSQEEVLQRLAGYVGRECIDRMVNAGTLALIRGFENFPRPVIRAVMRCSPRPSCVFVKDEGVIYVDESCAGRSTFSVEFILCASFIAQGHTAIAANIIADSTRYIIEHCKLKPEPKAPFRGFLRYLLRRHAVRLEYSGICAIEEYLIREPKRQLSQYSTRLIKKLQAPQANESIKVQDLFPLGLVLTEKTSRLTRADLMQSGLDLFDRKSLEAWRSPLSACVSLSREPLPPPAWFFLRKKFHEADLETEVSYPVPVDSADFSREDWSLEASAMKIYDKDGLVPVSSLDLRPFARIAVRSSQPKGKSHTVSLLQTSLEDPMVEEFTPLNRFPRVCHPHKTLVEIESAEVCPTLDWAYLTLRIPSFGKRPIRALCTSWVMQAEMLKMRTRYSATLTFWAHSLQKADSNARFVLQQVQAPDWPCTTTRCTVRIGGIAKAPSAAGTELVQIQCKTASKFTRNLIVVAPKSLLDGTELQSGDLADLAGIFLAGDLMNADAARAESALEQYRAAIRNLPIHLQNRRIRALAHAGIPDALLWLARNLLERKSPMQIQALLRRAANMGNVRAALALCALYLKENASRKMQEPGWGVVRDLAKYIDEYEMTPLTELAYATAPVYRLLPPDYQQHLLELTALKLCSPKSGYDYAMKLLEAKPSRSSQSALIYSQTLAAYLLQHAVARGFLAAGYEFAKCCALGVGTPASVETATAVLMHCCEQQFAPAKYWYAAFSQAGIDFFTKPRGWRKKKVMEGIDEGAPSAIFRTALFYLFDKPDKEPDQDSHLIAYSLLRHLKETVCDAEASHLLRELAEHMSEEELQQAPHFDVWKTLCIPEPDFKFPISKFSSDLHGPILMHAPFVRELDPDMGEELSPKMLTQVMFLAENASPFVFGYAQEHKVETDPRLRLTCFHEARAKEAVVNGSLLITSGRYTNADLWDLGGIYPFFETGIEWVGTIQASFISDEHASAVLVAGYRTLNDDCDAISFFDPLWPLMSQTYRIGDTYRFKLYGLCDSVMVLNAEDLKFMEDHRPIGSVCEVLGVSLQNARMHLASEILGIKRHVCQIAGVEYAMLLIHPIVQQDIEDRPMPVFISEHMLALTKGLKAGATVAIEAEIHGWAIDLAFAPEATTLN